MSLHCSSPFFFNDTATTEIYTLSLHDALPIWSRPGRRARPPAPARQRRPPPPARPAPRRSPPPPRGECLRWARVPRSEEHTSELQSQFHLVCRLLLEKKKKNKNNSHTSCHPSR